MTAADPTTSPRRPTWPLLAILALAAAVRVAAVFAVGPGVHVDEASNVWNAWCLAVTGADEHRVAWPWLYTGAFGDNRSPLFLYAVLPFQGLFGTAPTIARGPAPLAGVGAVAAIYFVARRLFDRRVALAAAAALAASPWQVFASSWGHESTLCPLLVLAGVALMLASGAPISDAPARPRGGLGFLAGLTLGIACFGYGAIRLYVPIFLIALVLANVRGWFAALRDPTRRGWLIAFVAGFLAMFAPLAYVHLVDPNINARANLSWVWGPNEAWPTRVARALARYPAHFGPRLLAFDTGNDPGQSLPRGFGVLHAIAVPFFVVGAWRLIASARRSVSARVLLAALLTYPAGDLLNVHEGPNLLRSSPGLAWLDCVVGVGVATAIGACAARRRPLPRLALGAAAVASAAVFLWRLHVEFAHDPRRWAVRTNDLREACAWLRPRLGEVDAVFWTQRDTSFAYAPVLVYLRDDPRRWNAEPLVRSESAGERFAGADLVLQTGRHHFLFTDGAVAPTLAVAKRVAFITRPGERAFATPPDAVVRAPDGSVSLELREIDAGSVAR